MRVVGVIEGFYGPPWSHGERLDLIRFCGRSGFDTWVHAPKDDPYHRARWRDPYPDDELDKLAELVRECERCGLTFAYAIAPGLDVCYTRELETLLTKCRQLSSAGVRSFQLLWDDIEHQLHCAEDEHAYAGAEHPSAAAQAAFSNGVARDLKQEGPLVVCPVGYAGTNETPYRRVFGSGLDEDIVVYWTGPEVVSLAVTRAELDAAVVRFRGHELLLWDNYPVNDWDTSRLFLGPLRGRDPALARGRFHGIVANAMVQAAPSKLALATIADWARDPDGYDPLASFEAALREHGEAVVESLGPRAAAGVTVPDDLGGLVSALALGVDAPTAVALLTPFV